MYLLDGVGAIFFVLAFGLGLVFLLIAIFVEAWVMTKFKYVEAYRRATVVSLTANLVSLAAGFIFITSTDFFSENNVLGFGLLFGITLLLECLVLHLMNKGKPLKDTILVTVVMNAVTYAIAFLVLKVFSFG